MVAQLTATLVPEWAASAWANRNRIHVLPDFGNDTRYTSDEEGSRGVEEPWEPKSSSLRTPCRKVRQILRDCPGTDANRVSTIDHSNSASAHA